MDYNRITDIVYSVLREINSYRVNNDTSHIYLAIEKVDVIINALEKELDKKEV